MDVLMVLLMHLQQLGRNMERASLFLCHFSLFLFPLFKRHALYLLLLSLSLSLDSSVILFVVLEKEGNKFDQRQIEHSLWKRSVLKKNNQYRLVFFQT